MAALAVAVAATAVAVEPIPSQTDQAPIIRDLPAVQPVHVQLNPDGTPTIRD